MSTASATSQAAPTDPSLVLEHRATERFAYLDNLKVILIAAIIVSHAVNGYADYGSWAYRDLREVSLSPVGETMFVLAATIPGVFLMGLFFLISGLLTPRSIDRKGPGRFARDRLLRLGVPFVVFSLVIWPVTLWVAHSIVFGPRSLWTTFDEMDPVLDNGPMWFVGVLLLYSLAYATWRRWRPPEPHAPGGELGARRLVAIGAAVAVASFVVRIWFPANSGQPVNLHLWEWPQCVAMFGLGIVCARHAWLSPVRDGLRRRCGWLALAAAISLPVMVLTADPLGLTEDDYFGGFGVPSMLAVTAEAVLVMCGSIWVLAWGQRHLERRGPVQAALARSSYAAFILQAPVLIAFALAMRPVDVPAEVKALVVALAGVGASFGMAWVLVTRTPLKKIL